MDFPIDPPILVKDTPKPRRIRSLAEARDFVEEQFGRGRPPPWRDMARRLQKVSSDEEAVETAGALRELLATEDLLIPDLPPPPRRQGDT